MNKFNTGKITLFILTLTCSLLIAHSASFALDVKRSVLKNGLTLVVAERHNLPVVQVALGIMAGSLNEPEEKSGLAGLTAALLTEGTKNRTARQISEEIEFVGGSVGASGGDDYASASLSVLKKDIDLGFDLLSDMILNPVFPQEELEKNIALIKGSLKENENNPGYIASREFRKAVFGAHPYGRLNTGTVETLDRIKREDLVEFHEKYYVPDNAIMVVVGDVTAGEVEQMLNKYFGTWKAKYPARPPLPEITSLKERKTITIDRDLSQANIILGHIGVSRDNPDYYAISVMNYILGGGGFSSRLMENIREERGLAYDIHSYFSPNKYGGAFQVGLQTKNESANTAIEEVLKEINKIRTVPVSDAELSDAKLFLTGSFPMKIETGSRIAGFLMAVEYYALGADYIDRYPQYINSVTKEDVLRVAEKYLDPNNYVLVVVANQGKAALRPQFMPEHN